jgi:hypothetical protein
LLAKEKELEDGVEKIAELMAPSLSTASFRGGSDA